MKAKTKKNITVDETFGSRLRKLRKDKGLSQTEFARKIGYKRSGSISYIENDKTPPDLHALVKITEALDVDLHNLITGKNSTLVENLMLKLKPFLLAQLIELNEKGQANWKEQLKLLGILDRTKEQNDRIKQLQQETEAIHKYYNEITDDLNLVLRPFGEEISDKIPPTWIANLKPE